MINRMVTIVFFGLLGTAFSFAQNNESDLELALQRNPNDVEVLTKLGILYHMQGVAGNEDAVEKGFTCFDKILQQDPSNAVAWAYRGSLWTMRGRDAWWPFSKLKDVDKGIDELDKAVDMASDNISIRLVRGINSVNLPSMFRRLPIAIKDMDYLLNNAHFSAFDPHLQATIFYWSGVAYNKDGQTGKAKELFQKAVSADPNSDIAQKANFELK